MLTVTRRATGTDTARGKGFTHHGKHQVAGFHLVLLQYDRERIYHVALVTALDLMEQHHSVLDCSGELKTKTRKTNRVLPRCIQGNLIPRFISEDPSRRGAWE